jgi:hypothetical protein
MADSVTIHGSANGNTYAIIMQKTGPDSANLQLQQLTPFVSDHSFDVTQIKANSSGTRIDCQASVFLGFDVSCTVSNNPPSVNIAAPTIDLNNTYQIKAADYTELTRYIVASHFPVLMA